jgi:hypothetical protein
MDMAAVVVLVVLRVLSVDGPVEGQFYPNFYGILREFTIVLEK